MSSQLKTNEKVSKNVIILMVKLTKLFTIQ